MSKEITYKCDQCGRERNYKPDWLTIGSTIENGLEIHNELPNRAIIHLKTYSDIHFCSDACLIGYLFKPNPINK